MSGNFNRLRVAFLFSCLKYSFYGLAFIKSLFVTYGTSQKNLDRFYNSCKSGVIYFLLPILKYSDTLCELKLKKSYTVYILEKYIPLLQVTKYIMLRSLLKYAWKGFEIVLRRYLIFKTLNFMYMNSPGNFHPTWMLWVIYKQTLF